MDGRERRKQKLTGRLAIGVLLLVMATSLSAAEDTQGPADPKKAESQALVKRFSSELQTALMSAMAAGGPQSAITVCKDSAPQIASQLSRESGAAVSRTSLRLRNPRNQPQAWQERVLREFDQAIASSSSAAKLEYFSAGDSDSGARYMKAIPMGALCLACHGSELAPEVLGLLESHYPHDRATGYQEGEVRGAFSVTWPHGEGT